MWLQNSRVAQHDFAIFVARSDGDARKGPFVIFIGQTLVHRARYLGSAVAFGACVIFVLGIFGTHSDFHCCHWLRQ